MPLFTSDNEAEWDTSSHADGVYNKSPSTQLLECTSHKVQQNISIGCSDKLISDPKLRLIKCSSYLGLGGWAAIVEMSLFCPSIYYSRDTITL